MPSYMQYQDTPDFTLWRIPILGGNAFDLCVEEVKSVIFANAAAAGWPQVTAAEEKRAESAIRALAYEVDLDGALGYYRGIVKSLGQFSFSDPLSTKELLVPQDFADVYRLWNNIDHSLEEIQLAQKAIGRKFLKRYNPKEWKDASIERLMHCIEEKVPAHLSERCGYDEKLLPEQVEERLPRLFAEYFCLRFSHTEPTQIYDKDKSSWLFWKRFLRRVREHSNFTENEKANRFIRGALHLGVFGTQGVGGYCLDSTPDHERRIVALRIAQQGSNEDGYRMLCNVMADHANELDALQQDAPKYVQKVFDLVRKSSPLSSDADLELLSTPSRSIRTSSDVIARLGIF